MIRLHNDFLAVDILLKGGEIQTITDLKTNQNYLWYKDPIAWKDCAIPCFQLSAD